MPFVEGGPRQAVKRTIFGNSSRHSLCDSAWEAVVLKKKFPIDVVKKIDNASMVLMVFSLLFF